jgi:hypothetical protein
MIGRRKDFRDRWNGTRGFPVAITERELTVAISKFTESGEGAQCLHVDWQDSLLPNRIRLYRSRTVMLNNWVWNQEFAKPL